MRLDVLQVVDGDSVVDGQATKSIRGRRKMILQMIPSKLPMI